MAEKVLYKLTDSDDRTRHGTQWGKNVTHTATGTSSYLCTSAYIHAYESPLVAVLMNSIHAKFPRPHCWKASYRGRLKRARDGKVGVKELTTLRRVPLPRITRRQRIAFGIYVVKAACNDRRRHRWANDYLRGRAVTAVQPASPRPLLYMLGEHERLETAARMKGAVDVARAIAVLVCNVTQHKSVDLAQLAEKALRVPERSESARDAARGHPRGARR